MSDAFKSIHHLAAALIDAGYDPAEAEKAVRNAVRDGAQARMRNMETERAGIVEALDLAATTHELSAADLQHKSEVAVSNAKAIRSVLGETADEACQPKSRESYCVRPDDNAPMWHVMQMNSRGETRVAIFSTSYKKRDAECVCDALNAAAK